MTVSAVASTAQQFFIFLRCTPGMAYQVGLEVARKKKAIVREVSSTSGDWDLVVRVEIEHAKDIGVEVASLFENVDGIVRTSTVVAYRLVRSV